MNPMPNLAPVLTAVLTQEGSWTVSTCPELGVVSQGHDAEEALANLKEAVDLFFEGASAEEVTERLKATALVTHFVPAHAS